MREHIANHVVERYGLPSVSENLYITRSRFDTSPEGFFPREAHGLTRETLSWLGRRKVSGSGFYASRGKKTEWTNVSRGTPKSDNILRLPRASTKLYQHLPSIKTIPSLLLPSHQNHTIPTSPEYLNHTISTSPEEQNHTISTSPEYQNHTMLTSPEYQNHTMLTFPEYWNQTILTSPEYQNQIILTPPE